MSEASSIPRVEEIVLQRTEAGLGFNIRGGINNIHVGSDPGIFVTTIRPVGAAAQDGRLNTGDKILELNGEDLREVPHQKAVGAFHNAGATITLLVERAAEQRIREQMQEQEQKPLDSSLAGEGHTRKEEEEEEEQHMSLGGVVRKWFWVPLVLGGISVLVYYYVRRRPSSTIAKLFRR